MKDHLTIVGMLPDYVLGKLDETSLRRVAHHLEECAICRDECANAMEILGAFANVPAPPACVRDRLLRQVEETTPAARRHDGRADEERRQNARGGAVVGLLGGVHRRQRTSLGRTFPDWALIAASAAMFLVGGAAVWAHEQQGVGTLDQRIQALISDPAAAYPLEDSDVGLPATGVVFGEPTGREVDLVVNGLPALPHDQRYQVWLFTTEDELISAGLLTPGADGQLRALLETPDPLADYVGVALTAEPATGSEEPTSDMVLGGSLPEMTAEAPLGTHAESA